MAVGETAELGDQPLAGEAEVVADMVPEGDGEVIAGVHQADRRRRRR